MSNSVFLKPDENGNWGSISIAQVASSGDANIASSTVPVQGNYLYNGSGWDAWRNNQGFTALSYAARTATVSTPDITNFNHRGIIIYFYIGVASGTGSVTLLLEGKEPNSSRYRQITAASYGARTSTGMTSYILYPGASTAANYNSFDVSVLPYQFRLTVNHADASTYNYSVAYALIM